MKDEEMTEPKDNPGEENQEGEGNGPDERYIKDAAAAVGDLTPDDFSSLDGAKIPTEADDGEDVTMVITGKAKNGFLTDVSAADCAMGDMGGDAGSHSKGRIKIMIMGGENGEGGNK